MKSSDLFPELLWAGTRSSCSGSPALHSPLFAPWHLCSFAACVKGIREQILSVGSLPPSERLCVCVRMNKKDFFLCSNLHIEHRVAFRGFVIDTGALNTSGQSVLS